MERGGACGARGEAPKRAVASFGQKLNAVPGRLEAEAGLLHDLCRQAEVRVKVVLRGDELARERAVPGGVLFAHPRNVLAQPLGQRAPVH